MASKKQLKDVDSCRQTLVLQNFIRTVPFLALLGLIGYGVVGLFKRIF